MSATDTIHEPEGPASHGVASEPPVEHVRIAIIGSGFGGLGMAIRLKQAGIDDFLVLERADEVGGTWQANTYPGCQCDVPSHLYSFSFALNPDWSRTFSMQPEIWAYLQRVCAQQHIEPHVRTRCELRSAAWDDRTQRWQLETSDGPLTADIVVAGMGGLSAPKLPEIPGLESFEGTTFHTATWNGGHALDGERVAIIGTGASAIQVIPHVQPRVAALKVFQRTPPWVMPHRDREIRRSERRLYRRVPGAQRVMRTAIYWARELFVIGFLHPRVMRNVERIARRHVHRQVRDPELRARVTPSYRMGCKRVLLSNDYYPALQRPNVEVVSEAIREIRPRAIVTEDGREHDVDTIVFGTGFRVTDQPAAKLVRGRDGRLLGDAWQGSMRAHLGTTVAGFPNLFMLLGPNTGLGHNSVVLMIESQLAYIMDCLRAMDARGLATVEVEAAAQQAFAAEMDRRMRGSVWMTGGCASWYLDAAGRNSTLWPGSTWSYRLRTRRFDLENYRTTRRPPAAAPSGLPHRRAVAA